MCFYFWLILGIFLMFYHFSSWKHVITTKEAERRFMGSIARGEVHDTECPEVIMALA